MMLRQVVGWGAPVLALFALFALQVAAGALGFTPGVSVVLVLGIVVGALVEAHGRLDPEYGRVADQLAYTLWILPGLIVWAAGLAIVFWQPDDILLARGLPLLGALLVGAAVFAQDREIARADDAPEAGALPRQLLSLLTYLAALGLFTLIYQIKERSVIAAIATALVAGLLSLALLRGAGASRQRTILYAVLIGMALGEVTWALSYWVVKELVGGAVLLLLYYVLVGLIEIVLRAELSRRLLAEYIGVGIVGFLFILSTAPWRP
jgi:hypothetical protein